MGTHYIHLGPAERDRIAALKKEDHSLRTIGSVLGVSHSTCSRELRRNSYATGGRTPPDRAGAYDPSRAQHRAYVCRHEAKFQGMKLEADQALRRFVVQALVYGWNPDEISGYLRRHQRCSGSCGEEGCGLGLRLQVGTVQLAAQLARTAVLPVPPLEALPPAATQRNRGQAGPHPWAGAAQ
jgi:hypothetical protein